MRAGLRASASVAAIRAMALLGWLIAAVPAAGQGQGQGQAEPIPMPLQVRVTPTAAGAVVVWEAAAGATSYTVHRWKRLENGSRCCDKHVRDFTARRFVDEPLPGTGQYLYRVVARLTGGVRGYEERTVTAPAAPTPTVTSAGAGASGVARRQPDTTVATIINPNPPDGILQRAPTSAPIAPAGGSASSGGSASTIGSTSTGGMAAPGGAEPVSSGTQSPQPPSPTMERRTLARSFTPVTVAAESPAARSGRYLVTVTGLRAGWTTKDGIIDQDGKGDEIMAAAFVRRYSRATAEAVEYTSLQTMVYGDINGYQKERVQAGRLTTLGGITDGDPIPSDGPVARALPAQTSVFPWRLWEGTLSPTVGTRW